MEIKYDNLNKLIQCYSEIFQILTPDVCVLIDADAITGTKNYSWTEEDKNKLYEIDRKLSNILPDDVYDDVRLELELNIAGIESESHLVRYLVFVRNKVNTIFELMQDLTEFQTYKLKYWGDVAWEMLGEDDAFHPTYLGYKNPATTLRVAYLYFIHTIAEFRDQIDSIIHHGKDFTTIGPIDYDSWPLELRVPIIRGMHHPGTRNKTDVSTLQDASTKDFRSLILEKYHDKIDEIKNILRKVHPPLINDDDRWINNKGAAHVYFTALIGGSLTTTDSYDMAGEVFFKIFGVKKSNVVKIPKAEYTTPKAITIYKEQFEHEISIIKSDVKNGV